MPLRPQVPTGTKTEVSPLPKKEKKEVSPPKPPAPQWDGREETLEACLRQAKAYTTLHRDAGDPMDVRDKRKSTSTGSQSPPGEQ